MNILNFISFLAKDLVRELILQIQDMSDPYRHNWFDDIFATFYGNRFGLRVVGVGQEFPCARVLWLFLGGAAERAGITVGDKVCGARR
jgi:hypothetical protein